MTFTTLTFVVFVLVVFSMYWGLRQRRQQNLLLVVVSYLFYGWWDYRFCFLMLFSSVVDFLVAHWIDRVSVQRRKRMLLAVSILVNLSMLGFFKYFNFFAGSLLAAANHVGLSVDLPTLKIILPVGISFYTFQTMGYTIDVCRGRLRAAHSLLDYLAYVSFFPQLVAGPIERATRLLPQFQRARNFHYEQGAEGCRLILWGFFKKLIVADRLGQAVSLVYGSLETASGPQIAFATVCFALQIYCDFSAYSDIAIGTARLFGIELMRNFAYPYFSLSLAEFWRRWHISLSTWFRDYVYIPLGGSRGNRMRVTQNVILTFLISGLWHGASWNFVIWGGIMGGYLVLESLVRGNTNSNHHDVPGGEAILPSIPTLFWMGLNFSVVCVGWVFFRAKSLNAAISAIVTMARDFWNCDGFGALLTTLQTKQGESAAIAMVGITLVEWLTRRHPHPLVMPQLWSWQRMAVYTLILWIILYAGPRATGPFIYFQF